MRPLPLRLTLLVLAAGAIPAWAQCTASLTAGPVKVRPYSAAPAPPTGPVVCARNEYCSFQVVVTATGEGCRISDVGVSGFARGAERLPDSNITIYREEFLAIFYRSSAQGELGEWPDPLIPKVDPEYGEARNAFPVEVRLVSRAYRKHPARAGRTLSEPRGAGTVFAGGRFTSGMAQRFELQIVRPGPVGTATFRWRSEPGRLAWSEEQATSAAPFPLENGVAIWFAGTGADWDFLPGDEFWIFAGPLRRQPVWVDVLIPADAAAGVYGGTVSVTADGRMVSLPVEVEVLPWTLPSTSSLPNHFLMSWMGNYRSHFEGAVDEGRLAELNQAYVRAALRNGITTAMASGYEPLYEFSADGRLLRADYTSYDAAVAPYMDGVNTPRGARWASLRLPRFDELPRRQFVAAARDFVRHARERGWQGRIFDYLIGEPDTPADFAALKERAQRMMEAAPEVPRLSTTDLNAELYGLVTRWCPLVNHVEPKNTSLRQWKRNWDLPRRAAYNERLRAGDSMWWYQSCESHGCRGTGSSPESDNWPSYMVDISAVANRVFGLLTVRYNIGGILYWDVGYAHHYNPGPGGVRVDPWESLYYFGGNGDGSLFYPGRPEQIGGTHDIPIETLRLKMIRDSLGDADYAVLLKQLGEGEFLEREMARVMRDAYHWNADPQAWRELRARLGRRIAARMK